MSNDVNITKVFRVFISSTFSDFEEERNYLQKHVFPELEKMCRDRGALFQPVDLRWGITDEAAMGQQTLDICLNEVRQCSEITPRPSFLMLLGDRYGWIPVPVTAEREEFETPEPTALMKDWYRLDENSGRYMLRPREGKYCDQSVWSSVENSLREDWQAHGTELISATEAEIRCGLDASWENRYSIFCFHRHITDIPLSEEGAAYSDMILSEDGFEKDPQGGERLAALESYISDRIPDENMVRFGTCWDDRSRTAGEIALSIGAHLKECILDELERVETVDKQEAALESERAYSEQITADFRGFFEQLSRIKTGMLIGDRMAVIYGGRGSGKSAFAAQIAHMHTLSGLNVIMRHIGISAVSSEPYSLMRSIAMQLGLDESREISILKTMIHSALEDGKTLMILDGVEKLDGAAALLKPFADLRNVLLTTSDERLAEVISSGTYETLSEMKEHERRELFGEILGSRGRSLSKAQAEKAGEMLGQSISPGVIRLSAHYASQMTSWDEPFTASSEEEIAEIIFSSLIHEKMHAPLLTRRIFEYLAMARNGVTLPDLMGMLQRDKDVFEEFNKSLYHELCRDEIPTSVLSRLYFDLSPYLRHMPFMGADVISFAFEGFREMTEKDGISPGAISNAIEYYEHQLTAGVSPAALSELPYLLLRYRGSDEAIAWHCRRGSLLRKFKAGLENEVTADMRKMDGSDEAKSFRMILLDRWEDIRRRPEIADSVIRSESGVLRKESGAECIFEHTEPQKIDMVCRNGSSSFSPKYALNGSLSWSHCRFSPDGNRLLGVMSCGEIRLFDLEAGTYSACEMPGGWMDWYMYAAVESDDYIRIMDEKGCRRLHAPDFWNNGLEVSAWLPPVNTGFAEHQAMSSGAPVTVAGKTSYGGIELLQYGEGEPERIPVDFLMRPSEVNHVEVSSDGDIAMVFRSGAIAATSGLYDETTSGEALMCCSWYDSDTKIAAASSDGKLFLFDAGGDLIAKADLSVPGIIEQHLECMLWDEGRGLLYIGHRCGWISVVKPLDGGHAGIRVDQMHSGLRMGLLCMALSPDGTKIALGSRGNLNEAVLNVYDTDSLISAAAEGGTEATVEVFDKNISDAKRCGGRWMYIYENMGKTDMIYQLCSAPAGSPDKPEYIGEAYCYAFCPSKDALFIGKRSDALSVLMAGKEYLIENFPSGVVGIAADDRESRLAVACENMLFIYDLESFRIAGGLFGDKKAELKKLLSVDLPVPRTKYDAPLKFEGDKLLICCEQLFAFYNDDEGVAKQIPDLRALLVIDTATGRYDMLPYKGFAADVFTGPDGIYLACGEGRIWKYGGLLDGGNAYMRTTENSGLWRYDAGGGEPELILDGSISCVLCNGEESLYAFDEGDILCRSAAGDCWFNIPAKPAVMVFEEESGCLTVLDDGAKNGGRPGSYIFSIS